MSLGCACSAGRHRPPPDELPGLRLTVLVENRAGTGCQGTHGFAAWLEAGAAIVLLDTGPDPDLLAANAAGCGCDLARVQAVVLSHGHDDHTGGLPAVVAAKRGRPLDVVLHPAATRPRCSRRTGTARAIGMPAAAVAALSAPGVRVVESVVPIGVAPGIWATGAVPRRRTVGAEAHLVLDADGRIPDPLDDDQALVVDTVHGLAVLCGCAHAGLINTLDHIAGERPEAAIALVAGGLHLGGADDGTIAALGRELADRHVGRLALGHCTGGSAERGLAGIPGLRVEPLACGTVLEIP